MNFTFSGGNKEWDNKSSREGQQNEQSTQANVNINTKADKSAMFMRIQDSNDDGTKGNVIKGGNKKMYNIRKNEPVFAKKEHLEGRLSQPPLVLSVINGINHREYMTSEEMRDDYEFMGLAETSHDFTNPNDDKQLLATTKAGSRPMINNGNDELRSGDLIRFAFSPFNKFKGDEPGTVEWVKRVKRDKNQDGRLIAEVQKVNVGDVDNLVERMFYKMFNMYSKKKNYPYNKHFDSRTSSKNNRVTDPSTLYSLGTELSHMNAFISGCRTYQPMGIIEINTPKKMEEKDILEEMKAIIMGGGSITGDTAKKFRQRLSKNKNSKEGIFKSKKHRLLEDPDATRQDFLTKLTKEKKEEQDDALKWLASGMGMIGMRSNSNGGDNLVNLRMHWAREFILTYYSTFIPSSDLYSKQAYKPSFKGMGNLKTDQNASSQLARILLNAPIIDTTVQMAMTQDELNKIDAMVLKGGGPGKGITVLLTGFHK